MKNVQLILGLFLCFTFLMPNLATAQDGEKQIKIVTKKIDENGEEVVTEITRKGGDMSEAEIEEMIKAVSGEDVDINVDIEELEEGARKRIRIEMDDKSEGTGERQIIIKDGESIEEEVIIMEGDGEENVFILDDEDASAYTIEKEVTIDENGEKTVKIKKMKDRKINFDFKMIPGV